jgi:rubredoxin
MAVEAKRGCGYRKVGGLYLVSEGGGMPCDRFPIPLDVCPVCSHGFKQARGFTWVDVAGLLGGKHESCRDHWPCPLCLTPKEMGKAGLIWIGEKFYKTPEEFQREGREQGFSRRIPVLPRGFKVGETWIMLAHPKTITVNCEACNGSGVSTAACAQLGDGEKIPLEAMRCEPCGATGTVVRPGVFSVWLPARLEKIVLESQRGSAEIEELIAKGITPVYVPDDDPDHRGSVYEKEEELEEEAA